MASTGEQLTHTVAEPAGSVAADANDALTGTLGLVRPHVVPARRRSLRRLDASTDAIAALAVVVAIAPWVGTHPILLLSLVFGWAVLSRAVNRPTVLDALPDIARRVRDAAVVALAVLWFAQPLIPLPNWELTLFVVATALVSVGLRCATRRLYVPTSLRVLVVGSIGDGDLHRWEESSSGRLHPVGFATPDTVPEALAQWHPDAVVAVPSGEFEGRSVQRLTWTLEAAGVPLLLSTRLSDVGPHRTTTRRIGSVDLLTVSPTPRRVGSIVKDAWERPFAALLLVLLLPVLTCFGLLVWCTSRGPALFRQQRVGRHGQEFTMLKFRTMVAGASDHPIDVPATTNGVLFKLRDDPRLTRVGRLLRITSLDELPQLINVVRGEMSLVGPRPALPKEVDSYDLDPHRRLAVKPGMTGLWQVSGRSDLPWDKAVQLDLDYVDNWSLRGDFVILARTVGAVLSRRGAY